MRDRARRKGLSEADLVQTAGKLLGNLKAWAVPIGDSDADAYDWEVREPGEDGEPRLKFALQAAMLEPGRLETLLRPTNAVLLPGIPVPAGQLGVPSMPMTPGMPPALGLPPIPIIEHQYHLGINGQQYGPYTASQLVMMHAAGQIALAATKAWRMGLPAWTELASVPELVPLFAGLGMAVSPPSMPPPLS